MSIFLPQHAPTEELTHVAVLTGISATSKPIPHRSGYPMDKIKCDERDIPQHVKVKLEDTYIPLVDSLNWLSTATRPDIATITNILSAYLHKVMPLHLGAVKHIIKYLKGSKNMRISFSTKSREKMHVFTKFLVDSYLIVSFTDIN